MKLMKAMYYVNVCILIVETITIYLYSDSVLWLFIMISAILLTTFSVYVESKKESSKNETE